jgi:uncharacterized protein with HEPN domain
MQRDLLLLSEMIQAAERAHELASGITAEELQADRLRGESLLWNFTVLGEASAQLSGEVKAQFPDIPWQQPARLRNRIVHGYWSIDLEILHTTAAHQLPSFARDLRAVLDALTADTETAPTTSAKQAATAAADAKHAPDPPPPAGDTEPPAG